MHTFGSATTLLVLLRALGELVECHLPSAAGDMVAQDCREAVNAVLGRVLLTAGPEEAQVDKPYRRGSKYPVPRQPARVQVPVDYLAQLKQRRAEFQIRSCLT